VARLGDWARHSFFMIPDQSLRDYIVTFLFPHEGETWENDPDDDGNLGDGKTPGNVGTRYGVDARSHPGIDIQHLTGAGAVLIYQHEFNTSFSAQMLWPLAVSFFDVHVNCGETEAIMILQQVLNLKADGLVGPMTTSAVLSCDSTATALAIPDQRDKFYDTLGQRVPRDRKYVKGWEARDSDLKLFIRGHRIG
jgi:lysozyme family protein